MYSTVYCHVAPWLSRNGSAAQARVEYLPFRGHFTSSETAGIVPSLGLHKKISMETKMSAMHIRQFVIEQLSRLGIVDPTDEDIERLSKSMCNLNGVRLC